MIYLVLDIISSKERIKLSTIQTLFLYQNTIITRYYDFKNFEGVMILSNESIIKGYAISPIAAEKLMLETFERGLTSLQNFIVDSKISILRDMPNIIQQQIIQVILKCLIQEEIAIAKV
jgi:hypothetical protein